MKFVDDVRCGRVECVCHSGSKDNMSAIVIEFKNGQQYARSDEFVAGPYYRWSDDSGFRRMYEKDARRLGMADQKTLWDMAFQASVDEFEVHLDAQRRSGQLSGAALAAQRQTIMKKMVAAYAADIGEEVDDLKELVMTVSRNARAKLVRHGAAEATTGANAEEEEDELVLVNDNEDENVPPRNSKGSTARDANESPPPPALLKCCFRAAAFWQSAKQEHILDAAYAMRHDAASNTIQVRLKECAEIEPGTTAYDHAWAQQLHTLSPTDYLAAMQAKGLAMEDIERDRLVVESLLLEAGMWGSVADTSEWCVRACVRALENPVDVWMCVYFDFACFFFLFFFLCVCVFFFSSFFCLIKLNDGNVNDHTHHHYLHLLLLLLLHFLVRFILMMIA
jgi:hypothetical protein